MKPRQFTQQFVEKTSRVRFKPFGVTLHETADPGACAQQEFLYFNSQTATSAHAFVDWFEDLQIIPWNIKAYHAKSPANDRFIGLEMCRPASHDPKQMKIVYWASVDAVARIFRWILKLRKVDTSNLMSHHEVSLRYKKSNHTDPTGLFREYGYTMEGFRADVQYRLDAKWEKV